MLSRLPHLVRPTVRLVSTQSGTDNITQFSNTHDELVGVISKYTKTTEKLLQDCKTDKDNLITIQKELADLKLHNTKLYDINELLRKQLAKTTPTVTVQTESSDRVQSDDDNPVNDIVNFLLKGYFLCVILGVIMDC